MSTNRLTIGGRRSVALDEVVNEHFLARYRALLDEEDAAFDELEHAFEDGDREHFTADLTAWHEAMSRKLHYLQRHGVDLNGAQIRGAQSRGTQLGGTELRGTQLSGTQLSGAGLSGASPAR
jgi:hypothetical protein